MSKEYISQSDLMFIICEQKENPDKPSEIIADILDILINIRYGSTPQS